MFTIVFRATKESLTFEVAGVLPMGTEYTGVGRASTDDDGTVRYTFNRRFIARLRTQYYVGTVSADGKTLSGLWGYSQDECNNRFFISRIDPSILVARPSPEDFEENRIKALWQYALTATRNQAQRQLYSWSYFKERRDARQAYLALCTREDDGSLCMNDLDAWAELDRTCTYQDVQTFYVLHGVYQRSVVTHAYVHGPCCLLFHHRLVLRAHANGGNTQGGLM